MIEPVRELFKDEVRKLGEVLGVPAILWRHPFPGPGLAVRVLGEVKPEKLEVIRECDEIVLEEIIAADLYRQTSRLCGPLARAERGRDGRRADVRERRGCASGRNAGLHDSRLGGSRSMCWRESRIGSSTRCGVNRVVYDISSKPPATIEWE